MGAKASVWVHRLLAGMLAVVGLWAVSALPLPIPIRVGIVATTAVLLGVIAFYRLPAFDPLGRVQWRLAPDPSGRKRCALTFDDGPSAGTAQVLDILARAQATATFFVLTTNALKHGDLIRRAAAEGHAIAIHGTTHQKLAGADEVTVEREVTSAVATLAALGIRPAPLYRTPHGLKSAALFRVARRLGLDLGIVLILARHVVAGQRQGENGFDDGPGVHVVGMHDKDEENEEHQMQPHHQHGGGGARQRLAAPLFGPQRGFTGTQEGMRQDNFVGQT